MTRILRTIRAVHPNAGTEAWYTDQLAQLLQAAHLDLQLTLSLAWNQTPPLAAKDRALALDATRSPTVNLRNTLATWGRKWSARFDRMSVKIAHGFARRNFQMTENSMRDALKTAGFTVKFAPTRGMREAYRAVLAENVGLIKSIQSQYLTAVQSHVWQSVQRGSDMATLSRKLQDEYGVSNRRAALISRDQNAKAKATIENTRRDELGIRQAIWQHSSAGKEPRPSHIAMHGQVFNIREGLYDDDEGEWVLPGQLINCRCTSRAVIPGLDE
jgi:SPP1 gp7 family putative phage head morphogenesis protein